jgi:hypothetical protein
MLCARPGVRAGISFAGTETAARVALFERLDSLLTPFNSCQAACLCPDGLGTRAPVIYMGTPSPQFTPSIVRRTAPPSDRSNDESRGRSNISSLLVYAALPFCAKPPVLTVSQIGLHAATNPLSANAAPQRKRCPSERCHV